MKCRNITGKEIKVLESHGCKAENWEKITVVENFLPDNIYSASFSGDVCLGCFSKKISMPGGVVVECGIYNALICNCTLEDDIYVSNVRGYISNYNIKKGAVVSGAGFVYTEGLSSFGNGTEVDVLDESGNRSVLIYEGMSAHTAWLNTMNIDRPEIRSSIEESVKKFVSSKTSSRGTIGENAKIINTDKIVNVNVGDGCLVDGALLLENGILCSSLSLDGHSAVPSFAGAGVVARDFIISAGSKIVDGVNIERCFIGESVEISKGFSSHDSLFFANTQVENGEASASFLGPFTVSMHKSTLMVGGMFSFCNFGSGTNQSNHYYKLGPIHNGYFERGCKTGSDAYFLWPGKVGSFTFIKGRHTSNPVTTDFPFSFLFEENGVSSLRPGAILKTVGLLRDKIKWVERDKRKLHSCHDKLFFEVLNPYTVNQVISAVEKLESFLADSESKILSGHGFEITRPSAIKGIKLYKNALDIYWGNVLTGRLKNGKALSPVSFDISDEWIDVMGLLAPESEYEKVRSSLSVKSGLSVSSIEDLWDVIYSRYDDYVWYHFLRNISKIYGINMSDIDGNVFSGILNKWETALTSTYRQMYIDASHELKMISLYAPGNAEITNLFAVRLKQMIDDIPEMARGCKKLIK